MARWNNLYSVFWTVPDILKFSEKRKVGFSYIWIKEIQIRIRSRIGRPWMPIPTPQNDADPTGSGSTTLLSAKNVHLRLKGRHSLDWFIIFTTERNRRTDNLRTQSFYVICGTKLFEKTKSYSLSFFFQI
jgi:hypothetical protein